MGKVKVHRTRPSLDMTPMVDLGFLLVTFFMLTATAATEEPVAVDMPSSVSEIKLPQTNILTISISKDGKVFFNLDGKFTRQSLLERIGQQYGIQFTENEIARFGVMSSSFGVPIQNLKEVLAMNSEERANLEQPGIPVDSLNNQLRDWIIFSRMSNPGLRVAIKGDQDSNYPVIEKVMNTLIDNNVNRFNLITNKEQGS